jgi:hypothetical protein
LAKRRNQKEVASKTNRQFIWNLKRQVPHKNWINKKTGWSTIFVGKLSLFYKKQNTLSITPIGSYDFPMFSFLLHSLFSPQFFSDWTRAIPRQSSMILTLMPPTLHSVVVPTTPSSTRRILTRIILYVSTISISKRIFYFYVYKKFKWITVLRKKQIRNTTCQMIVTWAYRLIDHKLCCNLKGCWLLMMQ